MKTLKSIALQAVYDITQQDRPDSQRADRIEKRFKIQGAFDHYVGASLTRQIQFLKQQSDKHDQLQPDRRSYLHR